LPFEHDTVVIYSEAKKNKFDENKSK
jgi:hypothetical protein